MNRPGPTLPLNGGRVVIVGGGVIGISIAYHLARDGYPDVVVLDRGLIGEGATAKATGGIRQQFSSEINVRLSREAVAYFERFADLVGEPFEFRQHGYLFVTADDATLEAARQAADMQRRLDVPTRVLAPEEITDVHPEIRVDDLVGGTYCPTDGSGSPADLVAAFARRARRGGVQIRQHTAVQRIGLNRDGQVCDVLTPDGRISAEVVVNAAGPWASRVADMVGVSLPVQPRPRQAFAIAPPSWLVADLPFTVDLDSGAYLHPERFGGVIGGTDRDRPPGWSESVDRSLLDRLTTAVVHRFPGLVDAHVMRGWAGLREMTPDDHAIVGPVEQVPGFWVAAGFSGHGFMHAPVIGREVSRWLLTGAPGIELTPLAPGRFAQRAPQTEGLVF